jgi:hypothetical protein
LIEHVLMTRKRPSLDDERPSRASIHIWTPLLEHLNSIDGSFTASLAERIFGHVVASHPIRTKHDQQDDAETQKWALAVWLIWLWSRAMEWVSEEAKAEMRRALLVQVVHGDPT